MATNRSLEVARRATEIYEERLRAQLEASHFHDFVAVEPDSGDFFLGETLSEAIQAARRAYPDRISFALRNRPPICSQPGCRVDFVRADVTYISVKPSYEL